MRERVLIEKRSRLVRQKEFPDELVRDVSEFVYRERLSEPDTASMIEKDGDNGEKLRKRAQVFDHLSRSYLRAFAQIRPEL